MEKFFSATLLVIAIFTTITAKLPCNAQTDDQKCLPSERKALLEFRNGLNDSGTTLSSWRGMNCCNWRGITCDNITGAVLGIDLHGFLNLSGEISTSLINLSSLKLLDLSSNTFGGIPIPNFFGSLKNLQYLNLSNTGFSGIIPPFLGNLSKLQYLDVSSSGFPRVIVKIFEWVSGLVSLKHLEMNNVDLSLVNANWLEILNMLPDLTELHLSACGLSGSISYLSEVNFTSLSVIDLSFNGFSSLFPDWIVNIGSLVYVDLSNCMLRGRIPLGFGALPHLEVLNMALNGNLSADAHSLFDGKWQRIEVINLASNKVHGKLPSSIGNMVSLVEFDMFDNYVEGGNPGTIGSLCKLVNFDISGNKMNGSLPKVLEGTEKCGNYGPFHSLLNVRLSNNRLTGRLPDWLGQLKNLETLSLDFNLFEGPLPDSLGSLQNLTTLSLAGNRLNGTLPESIGQFMNLTVLDVSSNFLTGTLSEVHFSKLKNLKILSLASNSFILGVDSNWLPPFQIRNLNMGSCGLGPSFPVWLKTQNQIMFLDISNTSVSGPIPDWFWDLSFNLSLLNVSFNQLQGQIPSSFEVTPFADVDFSSNLFEGPIPLPNVPIELLDLSNNQFSGKIPQNIRDVMPDLIFLSLSNNQLTGQIPSTIGNINNLMGNVPSSMGKCSFLKVLDLSSNNLSGEIPNSIGQLNQLQKNNIEGTLPPWLGQGFRSLRIINLRSNTCSGEIPFELSNLSSLQVLDLAENSFIGRIPPSSGDLKAMAEEQTMSKYLLYANYRGMYYEESLVVNLKNQAQKFTKTLSLLTAMDLSRNNFSGDFPAELAKLHGLVVLNLSRNHITSQIPESISRMHQLASLDLSSNDLSGIIPSSMASLSFLSYLNLSNNNLFGKIPDAGQMSTFGANAFEGNTGLCGAPLNAKCPRKEDPDKGNGVIYDEDNVFVDEWFYLSIGLGFAAGILVPYIVLMIRKPWSEKYFDFVDKVTFKLFFARRRA
ncbi:Leucine-rich repeat protein [Handroanthus impetiginosus]|uniref:Leucine-rich repeat protein n=1 Tax=Handroanthus impetiginosus TaxID=429701 RepID=A0A2G9IBM4_9LAMI|nr:Leucine-rich repeat protein [Handroanthus impetiginosus]